MERLETELTFIEHEKSCADMLVVLHDPVSSCLKAAGEQRTTDNTKRCERDALAHGGKVSIDGFALHRKAQTILSERFWLM